MNDDCIFRVVRAMVERDGSVFTCRRVDDELLCGCCGTGVVSHDRTWNDCERCGAQLRIALVEFCDGKQRTVERARLLAS